MDSRKVKKPKASEELEDFRQKKGKMLQDNVTEQSGFTRNLKVIEDSSSSRGNHDLPEELEPEQDQEQEIIYDDPQKIIEQYTTKDHQNG